MYKYIVRKKWAIYFEVGQEHIKNILTFIHIYHYLQFFPKLPQTCKINSNISSKHLRQNSVSFRVIWKCRANSRSGPACRTRNRKGERSRERFIELTFNRHGAGIIITAVFELALTFTDALPRRSLRSRSRFQCTYTRTCTHTCM